ncbi:MAG: DNA-binding protein WhiA [Candidatus Limnocylindrales bacterium]
MARLAVRLGQEPLQAFRWPSAAEHCRVAYLRGLFLARGSLSLSAGRVHLEFVVEPSAAPVLVEQLAELGLPAAWRARRGAGVVTWKSSATVTRFLQAAGASGALLELEARLVTRSLHGSLNRALNAETANLSRAVAASARQLEAIERLSADGRLARETAAVRAVARARRDAPEATLAELAAEVGLSRSAVQRSLERLERLAVR